MGLSRWLLLLLGAAALPGQAMEMQLPARCLDFGKYPASRAALAFRGPYVPPRVMENRETRRFRTRIRTGAAEGPPDFAGHLRLVSWGCGSGCIQHAVVSLKSGRAQVLPYTSEMGLSYRRDSRLLLINPPGEEPYVLADGPVALVWDEGRQSMVLLRGCDGKAMAWAEYARHPADPP